MGLHCFCNRRIVRFVIENTVEERILQLQEKKELVFEGWVWFVLYFLPPSNWQVSTCCAAKSSLWCLLQDRGRFFRGPGKINGGRFAIFVRHLRIELQNLERLWENKQKQKRGGSKRKGKAIIYNFCFKCSIFWILNPDSLLYLLG